MTRSMRANSASPARPLPLVRKSRHALGGEESAVPSLSIVASTALVDHDGRWRLRGDAGCDAWLLPRLVTHRASAITHARVERQVEDVEEESQDDVEQREDEGQRDDDGLVERADRLEVELTHALPVEDRFDEDRTGE